MVGRLTYLVCAGLCVCAAVVVRTIDWMLGVLRPEPPAFAFDNEVIAGPVAAFFSDPQVERHEAGMSHRAAARGI